MCTPWISNKKETILKVFETKEKTLNKPSAHYPIAAAPVLSPRKDANSNQHKNSQHFHVMKTSLQNWLPEETRDEVADKNINPYLTRLFL